ncbi:MAG: hydrogenase maturation nickel metallochaperone HypA [Candidatus Latescibacteria bacterium 4484_7]|nr:MAG: hydrogenase maturation nickel metallochaperone HypA [Candidatus Latescibacteria bacterium 4484_7]
MHEVSLMQNLLEVVASTARREGGEKVNVIHLKIGELSGVNRDSLEFAFEVLKKGTVAEEGKLEIERVPLRVRCKDCGADFSPTDLIFRCESCGSSNLEIVSGREMEIDYILMDDEEDGDGG